MRSNLPWKIKIEAFFHLTANISYPLMIVLSFLLLPAMIVRFNQGWFQMLYIDLPLWLASTASVSTFYLISQKELYPDWRVRLKYLPFLMSVGIGLSVSNSKAVMEACLGIKTSFKRTPKYESKARQDRWVTKKYLRRTGVMPILELLPGRVFRAGRFLRVHQPELSDHSFPDVLRRRVHLHGPDVDPAYDAASMVKRVINAKRRLKRFTDAAVRCVVVPLCLRVHHCFAIEKEPSGVPVAPGYVSPQRIKGNVLVLRAAPDQELVKYQQERNFYYLTGFDEPNAILASGCCERAASGISFLPERKPAEERWTGAKLGPGPEAEKVTGFAKVLPMSEFDSILKKAVGAREGRLRVEGCRGRYCLSAAGQVAD